LAIDEVQTGMGRTGKWFGYQHEGIKPDIITLAKGLGGGLPLGAMVAFGEAAKLFTPGTHGSTFGGNPISVAAARAAISVIEEDELLPKISAFGELLINTAQTFPKVKEVRGAGLLIGIEFVEPIGADILAALEDRGFLVNSPNPTTIRISPPLIVSESDVNDFLVALRSILVGNL
jgi:acetylornithine aminotransferase